MLRLPLLLSCFALALAASCREATVEPARVVRPMTGTYDFTTVLDTFTYETPVPSPPDCPWTTGLYCTHAHADSSGRLAGSFGVSDSVALNEGRVPMVYADVGGPMAGEFTGSGINAKYSGWLRGPLVMADTSSDVTGELRDPSGAVIRLYGTISGDSIVGKVFWLKFVARSPPQYRGRFVARRRP